VTGGLRFGGLTANDETDKDTGEMKQEVVIKKSCTGVVQNGFLGIL
jgi:hypothetical protein